MSFRLVAKYLGHFTLAGALLMVPSALWAIWFGEWHALESFCEACTVAVGLGALLMLLGRNATDRLYQREGLALVALGWIVTAGIGALPFAMDGVLSPVDAYFESMSGLTTTGSTVLTNIESVDKSILFWRSFTHWIGGLGIVLLFIAVLPYLGAGGKMLFRAESPGPDPQGLRPHIRDTASILWRIYGVLTLAQTALLMLAGMTFYDALCHTFGTLAGGGVSTYNDSIAHFQSLPVELIIIAFMFIGGGNFALYFAMCRGDWAAPFRNPEWRLYAGLLAVATLLVTINLMGFQGHVPAEPQPVHETHYAAGHALRVAAFQVFSIMSTTGFGTDDFDAWPQFSRVVLLVVMCIGGCAGSTAGGMKIVRVKMLFKLAYRRVESAFRVRRVRALRVAGEAVSEDVARGVAIFFFLYVMVAIVGTMLMSLVGLPLQSALSAVLTTLNTTGPGLEQVGAVHNFAFIPASGKVILSLCMVLGRLELYSVLVLFLPGFWRHS